MQSQLSAAVHMSITNANPIALGCCVAMGWLWGRSIELIAKRPRAWVVKDFLNPFEVAHFISLGRGTKA
jgi:hypothetical protein